MKRLYHAWDTESFYAPQSSILETVLDHMCALLHVGNNFDFNSYAKHNTPYAGSKTTEAVRSKRAKEVNTLLKLSSENKMKTKYLSFVS